MDGTIVDDEIVNDEIVDDEMMDTRPLLSFDNFVNNRPHRNDTSYIKMAKYIGKVMLGSFPKIIIILCCIIIAACTTELSYGRSHSHRDASRICYDNPKVKNSGSRICYSLMTEAISSILVAMFLMNFDVIIPCVDKMFRRLAHGFSLLVSIIMSIMLLVTSCLIANLYVVYCHYIKHLNSYPYPAVDNDYPLKCGHNEHFFIMLPVFGFTTAVVWGLNGLISLIRLVKTEW